MTAPRQKAIHPAPPLSAEDRPPVPARLISRRQLAERLGISERTVMRMEESGHLPPPVRIGLRRVGHWETTVPRRP